MILSFGYICMELQMDINVPFTFPCTITASKHSMNIGGNAANQIIAAARAGAKTSLIGSIGNDIFGKDILNILRREGIQTSGIAKKETPTSIINSIIDNNSQKALIILKGASSEILSNQIPNNSLNEKTLILLQNDINIDINNNILKRAKENKAQTIICINHHKNLDNTIFDNVDIAIVNNNIKIDGNTQFIITKHKNNKFDIFCGYFSACIQAGMKIDKAIKYGNIATTFQTTPYLYEVEDCLSKTLKP